MLSLLNWHLTLDIFAQCTQLHKNTTWKTINCTAHRNCQSFGPHLESVNPSLPCPSLRSRIALSMLAYKVHNYPVNFPNYPLLLHSFTTHSPSHYVLTIVLTRDTPPPIRQRAKLSHIACVTIRCDMRYTNWNFVSDLLHMAGTMNNPTQRQFHYNNIKIKSTIFFSFNRLISKAATRKHFWNFQLFSIIRAQTFPNVLSLESSVKLQTG